MNFFELRTMPPEGELVRLEFRGLLSRESWPLGHDPFVDRCGPEVYGRKVLADLRGLSFIDSSGMGWLTVSNMRFCCAGGALASIAARTVDQPTS